MAGKTVVIEPTRFSSPGHLARWVTEDDVRRTELVRRSTVAVGWCVERGDIRAFLQAIRERREA
jgi:hypothetical protein